MNRSSFDHLDGHGKSSSLEVLDYHAHDVLKDPKASAASDMDDLSYGHLETILRDSAVS